MTALIRMSSRCLYAVRAMIELARRPDETVRAADIAGKYGLSETFLMQVLKDLKRRGLVRSAQGKKGGFALNPPPDAIELSEIMAAVGTVTGPAPARHGRAQPLPKHPVDALLSSVWEGAAAAFRDHLKKLTLQDILEQIDRPVSKED